MRDNREHRPDDSRVIHQVGFLEPQDVLAKYRNLVPGSRLNFEIITTSNSELDKGAADPVSCTRQHIANQLKKYHFPGDDKTSIKIVTSDKCHLLKVDQLQDSDQLFELKEDKVFYTALLNRHSDGSREILLSEAIFKLKLHSDPNVNAKKQAKVAGRVIGVLLTQAAIEQKPHSLINKISYLLTRDIRNIATRHDPDKTDLRQAEFAFDFSRRHFAQKIKPGIIDRIFTWDNIAKSISDAHSGKFHAETHLAKTENLFTKIVKDKSKEYWHSYVLFRTPLIDGTFGNRLEALSVALRTLGSFRNLTDVDTVGQALIVNFGRKSHPDSSPLIYEASESAQKLSKAFEVFNNYDWSVPCSFNTDRADFNLANLHQRFVKTLLNVAKDHEVRPDHIAVVFLSIAYLKISRLEHMPELYQDEAALQAYLLYGAVAERFSCQLLAEKFRYAAFSQNKTLELSDTREILGHFLGLNMEAAREIENTLQVFFTVHTNELAQRLGFNVTFENRLKQFFSLYEKLEESRLELEEILESEVSPIAEELFKSILDEIRSFRTGSLDERRAAFDHICVKWANVIDTHPAIENVVRDIIDITDGLGIRIICRRSEDLAHLDDNCEKLINEIIAEGSIPFHVGLSITGVREINRDEVINSGEPRRDKVTKRKVVWKLRRYALAVENKDSNQSWEIPIEIQLITEDALSKQRAGTLLPAHWWHKNVRIVVNSLRRDGEDLGNRFCGAQMPYSDSLHDASSYSEAFDAACSSLDSCYVAVRDKQNQKQEISLPTGSKVQALYETLGLDPSTQVILQHLPTHTDVDLSAPLVSGGEYMVIHGARPNSGSRMPCTPSGVLRSAVFESKEKRHEVLAVGSERLKKILHDPFFPGAPYAKDLFNCINSYVAERLKLENVEEICLYLGILIDTQAGRSITGQRLLEEAENLIKKSVDNYFEFPESTIDYEMRNPLLKVSLDRYRSDSVLQITELMSHINTKSPPSIGAGKVSLIGDKVSVELSLNMTQEELETYCGLINGLALPVGPEILVEGMPSDEIELWLRDSSGSYLATLRAAHHHGLLFMGFNKYLGDWRNEEIPLNRGEMSGYFVPALWKFALINKPYGTKEELRESIAEMLKTLESQHRVLINTTVDAHMKPIDGKLQPFRRK